MGREIDLFFVHQLRPEAYPLALFSRAYVDNGRRLVVTYHPVDVI